MDLGLAEGIGAFGARSGPLWARFLCICEGIRRGYMRVLAHVIGLAVVALFIASSGEGGSFVSIGSVFIVLGGAIIFTLAGHSGRHLRRALGGAFSNKALTREDAEQHVAVLQTLRTTLKGAGWVALLIVIVGCLKRYDCIPKPATEFALLTVLYGQVLGELVVAPKIGSVLARAEGQTQP